MELMLCLVLALLSGVHSEFIEYDGEKYGCLLSPDICTPPEDCDGLTGNCQLPFFEREWRYKQHVPNLVDLVRDLRLRGYDVDVVDVIRALLHHQPSYWQEESRANIEYSKDDENLWRFLATLERSNQQRYEAKELRRSIGGNGPYADASPKRNPEMEDERASIVESEQRLRRMKELVQQAEISLAKKGKRLSDLDSDEVDLLARYLANILKRDERESKKIPDGDLDDITHTSITDSIQDSIEKDDGDMNVEELQEAPQDLTDSVEEPLNSNDSASDDEKSVLSDRNVGDPTVENGRKVKPHPDTLYIVIIVVGATVLLVILVTIISCIVYAYRSRQKENEKFIGSVANDETQAFGSDYQELCRQHYASKNSEMTENHKEIIDAGSTVQDPLITRTYPLTKPTANGAGPKELAADSASTHTARNSSVSSVSWSEEPVTANLDITTGHAVLSYMEDHLNNKDRLDKEWEEICGYEADSITTAAAITPQNSRKNRSVVALPYDHNRIKLIPENNHVQSDYINASAIIDNDPKRPLYIAAQGPLPSTIPDFWQMMWEQGCVAIVMLTPLVEEGVNQCARYWPDEGSCTYHNFEIHLVSEHIWCEDYLVRSLYLKHLGSGETRTITQFHFLSWPKDRVPSTPKPLLELRRKVTKCYKGHNSPVLVHCSDGVGRTGTYILLDLAIDRMLKGAKEIDIAATLEHIRDQRVGMVGNKEQFEFALTAVAEEVNAILKTLLH